MKNEWTTVNRQDGGSLTSRGGAGQRELGQIPTEWIVFLDPAVHVGSRRYGDLLDVEVLIERLQQHYGPWEVKRKDPMNVGY